MGRKKITYFKANIDIMKQEGSMKELQEVWESRFMQSDDPIHNFAMAWKHLRNKYKEIQDLAKQTKDPLDNLYDSLMQLKLDILEESILFQKEEFQELRDQIREAKLTKACRLQSLASVKWLGVGDKPKDLFFILLKAKQIWDLMHMLLKGLHNQGQRKNTARDQMFLWWNLLDI